MLLELKLGDRMERIIFTGGDKDGMTEDFEIDVDIAGLLYEGFGGRASPRGTYKKTKETKMVDGVMGTVWQSIL